jgi:predicted nucleotide-binding protein (sugar kinase/HSP70/actin superfamily)
MKCRKGKEMCSSLGKEESNIMTSDFRVHSREIPEKITINLSESERCMFAELLTKFGFGVDVSGDTFQHLYKRGLELVYNEYFSIQIETMEKIGDDCNV